MKLYLQVHQTSNLVTSRCRFAGDGKNGQILKTHVQGMQTVQRYCFCALNMQISSIRREKKNEDNGYQHHAREFKI